jgi:hypothetical protein
MEKEDMPKTHYTLLACIVLVLSLCASQIALSTATDDWIVENNGGFYTQTSDGVVHVWSNGGANCPGIILWKEVNPTGDFSFSVQVYANQSESCAIWVRPNRDASSMKGFNFEFGHYGQPIFLLARNFTDWTTTQVANGSVHEWYTMKLDISASPFQITTSVFAENGICIGSLTTQNIVNFGFQDIKDIGIGCWGYLPADYLFRNVTYTLQDTSSPTPSPTESPPTSTASITIDTQATATTAGATVNIYGNLTGNQNSPLTNKTVLLYYTFEGLDTWVPITSTLTNELGQYSIQWINTASGTFTLKAKWSGDETYTGACNTTTLSFLPTQNSDQGTQTFVFESNSTVTALTFDASQSLLSFNVSGPSNTTGYVKVTIAKSLLSNGNSLLASIDNTTTTYTLTETENAWVYTFNYHHSTHQINLIMPNPATTVNPSASTASSSSASSTQKPNAIDENLLIVALVAFIGILVGISAYKSNHKK